MSQRFIKIKRKSKVSEVPAKKPVAKKPIEILYKHTKRCYACDRPFEEE